MKKILITGGSGLVGTELTKMLHKKDYTVHHLSTRKSVSHTIAKVFYWNPQQGEIDKKSLEDVTAIIHLAGANIADRRWTAKRKKIIYDSRILSTRLLYKAIKGNNNHKIEHFISTSAIGFYGNSLTKNLNEKAPNGSDFLAKVCHDWEKEALTIKDLSIKTSILRLGIVFAKNGGALKEMTKTFPFFGATFGQGKQFISWIHIEDLCKQFIYLLENNLEGTYNAVSPQPIAQKGLLQTYKKVKDYSAPIIPSPEFVLKIVLGEMYDALAASQHCASKKIVEAGFEFEYGDLEEALKSLRE